jgi:hypothetical protein
VGPAPFPEKERSQFPHFNDHHSYWFAATLSGIASGPALKYSMIVQTRCGPRRSQNGRRHSNFQYGPDGRLCSHTLSDGCISPSVVSAGGSGASGSGSPM